MPTMMEATPMSATIPITTPSTVSSERVLCVRRVSSAISAFSPSSKRWRGLAAATSAVAVSGLITQRLNRVQSRRLARRINAEEQPYGRGNEQRSDHRGHWYNHGNAAGRAHQGGEQIRQNDSNGAAQRRHERSFHQKLHQNVCPPGAYGLAYPDLARAFRYAGQHYVHDHHSPDH